jgi:pheromone shutdown protein TraB
VQSLGDHQALLNQEMQQIFQSTHQQTKAELQDLLRTMQTEALAQMRATFIEAMPSIYTAAVAEQQEAIATQIGERLNQEMQVFQAQSISDHQVQLGDALAANLQTLNQSTKQDLQQQMSLLQADLLSQIGTTFNDAIPSIYAAAVDDVKAKFVDEMTAQSMQVRESFLTTINADLPAVQEVLRDNIQQMLATSLPNLELDLRNQLTAELQDLLLKVKFVLPK